MNIYFSGIGGVGIGPLAQLALSTGHCIYGSDIQPSPLTQRLQADGVTITFGQTTSSIDSAHKTHPIDWLVYTAALPDNHPELIYARKHGIKVSKRDEFLSYILKEKKLKLIAVAGTHGKTTTSGMLIWAFKRLNIPVSYLIGTTISFGPSGLLNEKSEYFIYECDEYDRNMLKFEPYLSLITSLDYDHPDTYKTEHVYKDAFIQFIEQSEMSLLWEKDLHYLGHTTLAASYEAYDNLMNLSEFRLPGIHNRQNAFLVKRALLCILSGSHPYSVHGNRQPLKAFATNKLDHMINDALNSFPGTGRRFERLAENLYSDYGHHPAEIAATLQLASELSEPITLVYQPHQNVRQHEIKDQYTSCMELAHDIYWLPTYLSREDQNIRVLSPAELTSSLTNEDSVHIADLDDSLWQSIETAREKGHLVLIMGAGSIDQWVRDRLAQTK